MRCGGCRKCWPFFYFSATTIAGFRHCFSNPHYRVSTERYHWQWALPYWNALKDRSRKLVFIPATSATSITMSVWSDGCHVSQFFVRLPWKRQFSSLDTARKWLLAVFVAAKCRFLLWSIRECHVEMSTSRLEESSRSLSLSAADPIRCTVILRTNMSRTQSLGRWKDPRWFAWSNGCQLAQVLPLCDVTAKRCSFSTNVPVIKVQLLHWNQHSNRVNKRWTSCFAYVTPVTSVGWILGLAANTRRYCKFSFQDQSPISLVALSCPWTINAASLCICPVEER